jgi:uncharacterized protein (TIGR00661 family)
LAREFLARGHDLVTLTSGPTLPSFFKPVGKHYHLNGPTLIMNNDRLSYFRTTIFNILHLPEFLVNFFKLRKWMKAEKPDLIVEDHEFFTSNCIRFSKRSIPSFSVDHQSTFVSPMFPFRKVDWILKIIIKIFTYAKVRLCSSFIDYGEKGSFICIPPILREEVLNMPVKDNGSIVVYHSSATVSDKEVLKKICPDDRPFIFYGYDHEIYKNLTFKPKGEDFLKDLAQCHVFITNCGFISVCEALVMGKKLICQPLKGHAEQEWNGEILKAFPNVRVVNKVDYQNLEIDRLSDPDPEKIKWLSRGLQQALHHILQDQKT